MVVEFCGVIEEREVEREGWLDWWMCEVGWMERWFSGE